MSEPKNASAATKTISVTESSEASIQPRLLQDEDVTLTAPILRGSKPLSWKGVPDTKWPGMYRIRRPDDTLTEMVNLTRARDALLGRGP